MAESTEIAPPAIGAEWAGNALSAADEGSVENDASVVSAESAGSDGDAPAAYDVVNNAWHDMLPQLKLNGMARQLAEHCLFKSQHDGTVILSLDSSGETLKTDRTEEALQQALATHFSQSIKLVFDASDTVGETPEKRRIRLRQERQRAAERAIADDPVIQELQQKWGGIVLAGSIKPNRDVAAS